MYKSWKNKVHKYGPAGRNQHHTIDYKDGKLKIWSHYKQFVLNPNKEVQMKKMIERAYCAV